MPAAATTVSMDRRGFLKLSVGSAALLSTGALTASLAGCSSGAPPAAGYGWLRQLDIELLTALAPAALGATLPVQGRAEHISGILKGIDGLCLVLSVPNQKPLRQLLDLLNAGLTRRLAAGVGKPWRKVSADEAAVFLSRWRDSSIGLFNAGYRGLSKLIVGTWLGMDAGLAATGYPGPWKPMFDAVNTPATGA